MPLATALLKLLLFVLWARPTYKLTVDMYEKRERRLGILPDNEESGDETKDRITERTDTSTPTARESGAGARAKQQTTKTG
ncbi:hypothetical protein NUH88_13725 [Nisaea acidiphila]|uniref:Uncharacterized protein n=1 Tax=Nisaea acidiphila TaxID=1862145 RepID=A0A9J7ANE7_9PROT|nr:hypothetical protein [Nisaea acidiphila]UUX48466.1 hypothetical protein NUH88_13725 [Nisaea acidiphila]